MKPLFPRFRRAHLRILKIKSVEKIHPKHEAQLVNYLRMTGFRLGLLVNFSAYPKVDIRRRVV